MPLNTVELVWAGNIVGANPLTSIHETGVLTPDFDLYKFFIEDLSSAPADQFKLTLNGIGAGYTNIAPSATVDAFDLTNPAATDMDQFYSAEFTITRGNFLPQSVTMKGIARYFTAGALRTFDLGGRLINADPLTSFTISNLGINPFINGTIRIYRATSQGAQDFIFS